MKKSWRGKKRFRRSLGALEIEIMKVLWKRGEATGKEVWEEVSTTWSAALTTVLTVMERLSKKGLIEKTKDKGPFIYSPLLTAEDFTKEAAKNMLKDYMTVSSTSLINSFVDIITEMEPDRIEHLSNIIEKKKRECLQNLKSSNDKLS